MINYASVIYKGSILGAGSVLLSHLSKNNILSKVENVNDNILRKDQFLDTTILLPTLNEEWMIEKTLQSIKNQNIYRLHPEKFEILIVDSESEDNTIQIAKNYVNKIISLPERNLVKARTIGVEQSRGDIIVFIDADTIYPINWLNTMLKHYNNHSEFVIAVSGPEIHPTTDCSMIRNIFEPILVNFNIKRSTEMIGHNSSCYKWAFYSVNGFDVSFNYNIKSGRDTSIVMEENFANKLKTIGTFVYDNYLVVYDYGLIRRHSFNNRKKLCNKDISKISDENKYLCRYWDEREKGIRF